MKDIWPMTGDRCCDSKTRRENRDPDVYGYVAMFLQCLEDLGTSESEDVTVSIQELKEST